MRHNKFKSFLLMILSIASIMFSAPIFSKNNVNIFDKTNRFEMCDLNCKQYIQTMIDDYRNQHQKLAMQMSIGLPDNSILNFNSGTLTGPKLNSTLI